MAGEPESRLNRNRSGTQGGQVPQEGLVERLDRLEKEVARLRADFAQVDLKGPNRVDQKAQRGGNPELKIPFPSGDKESTKGQLPEKEPQGKNDRIGLKGPRSRNYLGLAIGALGWFFSALSQAFKFILIPWVRNILLCLLTFGILFSDWWVPMSSVWVLGPIWERIVLLGLAGIWWWLLALLFQQTLENQDLAALPNDKKDSRVVESSTGPGNTSGKISGVDKLARSGGRLGSKAG